MPFHAQILKDGVKNFTVQVKSLVSCDFPRIPIVDLKELAAPKEGWKGLRLDSALWLIQEKMGLRLWWEDDESSEAFILPMESRNFVRFDDGVPSPRIVDGWKGKIYLSSFKCDEPKSFFLLLDFDKQ